MPAEPLTHTQDHSHVVDGIEELRAGFRRPGEEVPQTLLEQKMLNRMARVDPRFDAATRSKRAAEVIAHVVDFIHSGTGARAMPHRKGDCWLTDGTIAADLRMGVRAVGYCIAQAVACGYFETRFVGRLRFMRLTWPSPCNQTAGADDLCTGVQATSAPGCRLPKRQTKPTDQVELLLEPGPAIEGLPFIPPESADGPPAPIAATAPESPASPVEPSDRKDGLSEVQGEPEAEHIPDRSPDRKGWSARDYLEAIQAEKRRCHADQLLALLEGRLGVAPDQTCTSPVLVEARAHVDRLRQARL